MSRVITARQDGLLVNSLLQYGPEIFSSDSRLLGVVVFFFTIWFALTVANVVLLSFSDPPPILEDEDEPDDDVGHSSGQTT